MEGTHANLSQLIRSARKSAGLTQVELSRRMKVGRSAIALWETGKTNPNIQNLKDIIRITDVSPDYFISAFNSRNLFDRKEMKTIEFLAKEKAPTVNLESANTVKGIKITKEELEKILDYASLIVNSRKNS